MAIRIVTNNPDIPPAQSGEYVLEYRAESIRTLMERIQRRIAAEEHFLADPQGGYAFRPNPYHTFFLGEGRRKEEVSRLTEAEWMERLIRKYDQEQGLYLAFEQNETRRKDCRAIDTSIAMRILARLME